MARDAFPGFSQAKDGVLADPDVILKDGVFHAWFSAIAHTAKGETVGAGIGNATSADGIHWTPSRNNPLRSLGENPTPLQPSVLWNPTKAGYEMWFTADKDEERQRLPAAEHGAVGYWYAFSTKAKSGACHRSAISLGTRIFLLRSTA